MSANYYVFNKGDSSGNMDVFYLVAGWSISWSDEKWVAYCPTDDDVSVTVEGGYLCVADDCQYYPGNCHPVPLEVVRVLLELTPEAARAETQRADTEHAVNGTKVHTPKCGQDEV